MPATKFAGAALELATYWNGLAAVLSQRDFRWYWLSSSTQGLAIGT